MLPFTSLWLAMLGATTLVFVASTAIWLLAPHRRTEPRPAAATGERGAAMGRNMVLTALWFLGINVLVAIIAAATMGLLTPAREIFWVTGIAAFLAHGAGEGMNAIWRAHPWEDVIKQLADSVVYAALTGAAFVWFWP